MKCFNCGAEMREKSGRYGRFLGSSNWPRCNGARDLKPTDNSTPTRRRDGEPGCESYSRKQSATPYDKDNHKSTS
jgi:ssDNA-binding Zn-finger/Zn-ribbon topoisomerase 1